MRTEEVVTRLIHLLSDTDANTAIACTFALGHLAASSGAAGVGIVFLDPRVFKWASMCPNIWERMRSSALGEAFVEASSNSGRASNVDVVSGSLRVLRDLGAVAATPLVIERVKELMTTLTAESRTMQRRLLPSCFDTSMTMNRQSLLDNFYCGTAAKATWADLS